MSEEQKKSDNRPRPTTEAFRAFVREGWAPRAAALPERAEVAPYAAARREAVIADLDGAVQRGKGERWVEGLFGLHARHQGNGTGYDSICAAGDHANTCLLYTSRCV